MMAELKPCPFCGGEAKIKTIENGLLRKTTFFYIRCTVCGNNTAVQYEKAEAINAWNRRCEQ